MPGRCGVSRASANTEAGVTLAEAQAAAQGADRLFPLSLASEGTCTIGGNLSTNAGGDGDTRWCPGNRHNEKNMLFAYRMQSSLVKSLSAEDRGVHHARFEVLREAATP